ncbi:MAG: CMP-binding protein, partial [Eubacteriales bacterium]
MDEIKIIDFQIGEKYISYFLLRRVECKIAANGNKYLDLTLGDSSGEIVARLWDYREETDVEYGESMLVKASGSISQWQGKKQMKIEKIRPVKSSDKVNVGEFVASAPIAAEDMYLEIQEYIKKIKKEKIREIVKLIVKEGGDKLLFFPAAVQNHHALRSGLLYHTLSMLRAGERLMEVYTFLDSDLLLAGIILHDMA